MRDIINKYLSSGGFGWIHPYFYKSVYGLFPTIQVNNNIILLCHELPSLILNNEHFCHRILISNWIELETGIIIPEVAIDSTGNIKIEEMYDLKPRIKKLIKTL